MTFFALQTTIYAAELGNDFSSNSEIELDEIAMGGDYRNKNIKINTLNGATTLTVRTDGKVFTSVMPYQDCELLWNYILGKHAELLEDVKGGSFPDESTFTVKIRVDSSSHNFKVEGVDSLFDPDYKDIVKAIINEAGKYTS